MNLFSTSFMNIVLTIYYRIIIFHSAGQEGGVGWQHRVSSSAVSHLVWSVHRWNRDRIHHHHHRRYCRNPKGLFPQLSWVRLRMWWELIHRCKRMPTMLRVIIVVALIILLQDTHVFLWNVHWWEWVHAVLPIFALIQLNAVFVWRIRRRPSMLALLWLLAWTVSRMWLHQTAANCVAQLPHLVRMVHIKTPMDAPTAVQAPHTVTHVITFSRTQVTSMVARNVVTTQSTAVLLPWPEMKTAALVPPTALVNSRIVSLQKIRYEYLNNNEGIYPFQKYSRVSHVIHMWSSKPPVFPMWNFTWDFSHVKFQSDGLILIWIMHCAFILHSIVLLLNRSFVE